jgi:hypothetical protein
MVLAEARRRQPLGLPYRKEARVPDPLSPYERSLPEAHFPSARIERLRKADPKFISNRDGWRRFYRWQDWHNRKQQLTNRIRP